MKNKVLILGIILVIAVGGFVIYEISNISEPVNGLDVVPSGSPSSVDTTPINVDDEFNLAMKDIETGENIIDETFLELFEFGDATYLLNVITEYYLDAWRDELKNVKTDTIEIDEKALNIKNKIINQIGGTTGEVYYSNIAQARIYRQEVLNSIDSLYEYSFKVSSIDKLKEAIGFEE